MSHLPKKWQTQIKIYISAIYTLKVQSAKVDENNIKMMNFSLSQIHFDLSFQFYF